MEINPLCVLYGEYAIEQALRYIKELSKNSNIPFDAKYTKLGIDFLMLNAQEIIKNSEQTPSLESLVSRSFGEAAIYKYNCCGGVL